MKFGTCLALLACSPAVLGEACDDAGCLSSEASAVLLQASVEYSMTSEVDFADEVPHASADFLEEAAPAREVRSASATNATDASGAWKASSDTQDGTAARDDRRAGAKKVAAGTLSAVVAANAGHAQPPNGSTVATPAAAFGFPTWIWRPVAVKLPEYLNEAEALQIRLVGVLATVAIVVALVSQQQLHLSDGVCKRGHRLQPSTCSYHGACGLCGVWIGPGQSVSVCAPCSYAVCAKCMSAGDVLRHCKRIRHPSNGGASSSEGGEGNQGAKNNELTSLSPAGR